MIVSFHDKAMIIVKAHQSLLEFVSRGCPKTNPPLNFDEPFYFYI